MLEHTIYRWASDGRPADRLEYEAGLTGDPDCDPDAVLAISVGVRFDGYEPYACRLDNGEQIALTAAESRELQRIDEEEEAEMLAEHGWRNRVIAW